MMSLFHTIASETLFSLSHYLITTLYLKNLLSWNLKTTVSTTTIESPTIVSEALYQKEKSDVGIM